MGLVKIARSITVINFRFYLRKPSISYYRCVHSPAGDHRSRDLRKYFEEDVKGPRVALHVLLKEGVGAGARPGPAPLPPHDQQEHAEAPCPDAEACVDCGKKSS